MIIAVDFDGTCVEHMYPEVGPDVPHAAETLGMLAMKGHQLILWTMRSGSTLADAVEWFAGHNIELFGVNRNPQQSTWSKSPKAYAHMYIDDAALGCPLMPGDKGGRPMVDWIKVLAQMLRTRGGAL